MKTAIIYCSKHNGNTKRLLDAIAARYEADLYEARQTRSVDLGAYDLIGLASGVYAERIHRSVLRLAQNCLQPGQAVFGLYTAGTPKPRYDQQLIEAVAARQGRMLGIYSCMGYYKLFFQKRRQGHPDAAELAGAVSFFERMRELAEQ